MRDGPPGKTHWKGESLHNSQGAMWAHQVRGGFECRRHSKMPQSPGKAEATRVFLLCEALNEQG